MAPIFSGFGSLDAVAPAKAAETARGNTQSQAGILVAGVDSGCPLNPFSFDQWHDTYSCLENQAR